MDDFLSLLLLRCMDLGSSSIRSFGERRITETQGLGAIASIPLEWLLKDTMSELGQS